MLSILALTALLPLAGCESTPKGGIRDKSSINWNHQDRVEIPLQLDSNGLPTIRVRIGDQEVEALVDSGSGAAFMTPDFAARDSRRLRSTGGMQIARDVGIQIGSLSLTFGNVFVNDLPARRELLLGKQLFSLAVVEMDFENGRMTLIRPRTFVPPVENPLRVETLMTLPTVKLKLMGSDRAFCAIVDTGYNLGVAVSEAVADELSLAEMPSSASSGEGILGKFESRVFVPLDVLVDGDLYRKVPAATFPGNDYCNGLLGMAVLSHHRVIFDLENHRIWLLPRVGIHKPE